MFFFYFVKRLDFNLLTNDNFKKDFKCSSKLCVLWECPEDSIHDFEPDQGEACCPIPTDRLVAELFEFEKLYFI